MVQPPARLDRAAVDSVLSELQYDPSKASIREVVAVINAIESKLNFRYLRMEFGVPGMEPNPLGPEVEISYLRKPRVAGLYPPITGVPLLKEEARQFLKAFLNVDVPERFIIPTAGAMQATFLTQAVVGRLRPERQKVIVVAPCFSVQRVQIAFLGLEEVLVDLYDRATWLLKVEELCASGSVAGILYSTPNNPSWMILTENETRRIGEIATKYDVVAIEDAAYFSMDFRRDYSVPSEPPYPPTVARHTENFVFALSGSKIFSYAGQRVGLAVISPALADREFEGLGERYGYKTFLDAFVMGGLYCTTSGVSHSAQYALAALLSKARRGEVKYLKPLMVYAERAHALKQILLSHGFHLVYADDAGEPLADGFFFTFACPGFSGAELVRELIYYGISSTPLSLAGSTRTEGARACVSMIPKEDFPVFEARIKAFRADHPST